MKRIVEVKHFSHDDLDGIGCILLGKHMFTHTSHTICSYDNIDSKIKEFISSYIDSDGRVTEHCPYEILLITDISVTQDTATLLDYFQEHTDTKVILLDHHPHLEWLNEYEWAVEEVYGPESKNSGTSLMMQYLKIDELNDIERSQLNEFAEEVRLYDTFEWLPAGLTLPKQLNDLLHIIGYDAFIERFMNDISVELSERERYLCEVEEDRIARYIDKKEKEMVRVPFGGYVIGIVFIEQHRSIVGNVLSKRHPNLDFIMLIEVGNAKVSFRTTKEGIDVGAIAKKFFKNGGGHPKAAGFEFHPSTLNELANDILYINESVEPSFSHILETEFNSEQYRRYIQRYTDVESE